MDKEKDVNKKIIAYCLEEKHYLQIVMSNDFTQDDFMLGHKFQRDEKQRELRSDNKETDGEWEEFRGLAVMFSMIKRYYDMRNEVITDFFVEDLFQNKKITKSTYMLWKSKMTLNMGSFSENELFDLIEVKKRMMIEKKCYEFSFDIVNNRIDYETQSNVIMKTLGDIVSIDQKANRDLDFGMNINDNIEERKSKYQDKSTVEVFKTGFNKIDNSLDAGGLQRSHYTAIIGRKGAGKSLLMMNIAYNMWKQHKNICVITLEVNQDTWVKRIDSFASKVAIKKLSSCEYQNQEEKQLLMDSLDYFGENKDENGNKINGIFTIKFMTQGTNLSKIDKWIDEAEKRYKVKYDVVVIDYAGIIEPKITQKDERTKYKQISDELKIMAQTRNCVVLTAYQMNRNGEKSEFASSSNIAHSDSIADSLELGIEIKIDKNPSVEEGSIASFKNRNGSDFFFPFDKRYDIMAVVEKQSLDDIADSISKSIQETNINVKGWGFNDND
jgi:replicative DNA helicase